MKLYLRVLIFSLSLVVLGSCVGGMQSNASTYMTLSGERFHTYYQIKYKGDVDYTKAVDSTFNAFNYALNPFDSTSLISAINRSESTYADSMIQVVWQMARHISEVSKGRYDVTCAPLISAWGFGFDSIQHLTPQIIDSLKQFVGYRKVIVENNQMYKQDTRLKIDFSSISKGFCSDLVGQTLENYGIQDYMVELGGEIAWRGLNPQGKPWRIGINTPVDDSTGMNSDIQLIVALDRTSGGLATSGNYRNYRVVDGRKVAHTIDPHSGYPIQTDILSATIIAPSCMLADGLATACMTMSAREVPGFIKQFGHVEYLLILGSGSGFTTQMSEGFRSLIVE